MKRTKQQNQKFNQGITLVALVVTIVVLLILSSVSLNLVLGDNGIIVKAKEAAETTAAAQEKEAMERNLLEKELENSLSTPAVEPTDGVKIPTGFYYVGGTKASGIVISDNKNDKNNKNLLFEITDPELLEKTGGIVQGMSGSPIIQGDFIIGAVTHVVVDDPTKGYGILITNMLKEGEN